MCSEIRFTLIKVGMSNSTEIRRTNKLNEFRYSRIEYGSRSGEDRKEIKVNWFQFLKIFRILLLLYLNKVHLFRLSTLDLVRSQL